jgi:hypothetical protein
MSWLPSGHPGANVAVVAFGGCFMFAAGYLGGGFDRALLVGIGGAWMSFVVLLNVRARAAVPPAVHDSLVVGSAARLSLRVLRGVMVYEQAVFGPLGPGYEERRAAARAEAYRMAAHDDLPEPVRRAAADALAALDHRDRTSGVEAVALLSSTVRAQIGGSPQSGAR